jgi:hypothetical protein
MFEYVGVISGFETPKITVFTMIYHRFGPIRLDDDITASTTMNVHIKLLTIWHRIRFNAMFLVPCGD